MDRTSNSIGINMKALLIVITLSACTTTNGEVLPLSELRRNYCASENAESRTILRAMLKAKGEINGFDYCTALGLKDMLTGK